MKFKIFVSKDRVEYILNELGDKVKVGEEKEGSTTIPVEIIIETDMDALCLFHAGILAGLRATL